MQYDLKRKESLSARSWTEPGLCSPMERHDSRDIGDYTNHNECAGRNAVSVPSQGVYRVELEIRTRVGREDTLPSCNDPTFGKV